MAANSLPRRLMKQVLYPVLTERSYQYFQGLSKAWDICTGKGAEPELDLLPLAVREGETVLDIGANYGYYAYPLSRVVGRTGRVYAFEPVPFTFGTLQLVAKILRFQNVELIDKGCSDRAGKISFTVPVQTSGALSAGQAYISGRDDDRAGKETQVRWANTQDVEAEVITLDQFLPYVMNLSLIKCDIEGAELWAFRGAEKMIDRNHPSVICEINPWFLEGFSIMLEDLAEFFFHKGYLMYRYENDPQRKLSQINSLRDVVEDNYVFIHPVYRDRFATLLG